MKNVHFRTITAENLRECLRLDISDDQREFVASNAVSLAEAHVNPKLRPFAVYDNKSLGFEYPVTPMVGFTMLEIEAGVGFLLRMMIDRQFQRQGYANATLRTAIKYLRSIPEVQIIATSYRHENQVMAKLLRGHGFVPWEIAYANNHPSETYLRLAEVVS